MPTPTIPILLCTLNARYHHTSFGLRYLLANLREEARAHTSILEGTTQQDPRDFVESILNFQPKLVGFSVAIWNVSQTLHVVQTLRTLAPEIKIVLGGPEISHETEIHPLFPLCDFVVVGEGDLIFRDLVMDFLKDGTLPGKKILQGPLPDLQSLTLPYEEYTDEDIQNRILYVEASRGCAFRCEYCLSSLDLKVRRFPLEKILSGWDRLIERGARHFKFVDRTFNLHLHTGEAILDFFLSKIRMGIPLELHFEMIPDRFPESLRSRVEQFPAHSLQFEIGIQTWDPTVSALVSRKQNTQEVQRTFDFLRNQTQAHLHADLIAGLPGETLETFSYGFNELLKCRPHEIQIGILKRLRGTPIIRHEREFHLKFQVEPPYSILSTSTMDFKTLQKMTRLSQFWDLYFNQGRFSQSMKYLLKKSESRSPPSAFHELWEFTDFLIQRHTSRFGIALLNLVESFWLYYESKTADENEKDELRRALIQDYTHPVMREIPPFLRSSSSTMDMKLHKNASQATRRFKRQQAHGSEPAPADCRS